MKSANNPTMPKKPTYEELEKTIKKQEQTIAALRASEENYHKISNMMRLMCDNAPDMIWAKDMQKRYIFANKAICRDLLNAEDTEEPVGKTDLFFAQRERDRHSENPQWHTFGELCQDSDKITMDAGKPCQFDEFGNVQGKFLFLDVHKAPFLNDKGEMIGTVGCGRDVTEQKRAEDGVRKSEENLRLLLDLAPDAFFHSDSLGNFILTNKAANTLTGYSREELLSMNMQALFSDEEKERNPLCHDRDDTSDTTITERNVTRKDGSIVTVETISQRMPDGSYECFMRDISERRLAEAEKARMMTAVEQTGEAIIITDPSGIIEYVNPAFEKVTGFQRKEIIGQNARILKSGKHDTAYYEQLWKTLQNGATWRGRMTNRRKDGSLYTEDVVISPVFDSSGNTIHYIAVKRDVTKQLQTSAMLAQAQKMESIGRLAGGIAHDYNNMLSVILGHAEMALLKLDTSNPLYEELIEIRKAAKRSADITGQLLAFARKQTVAPKVLDLNHTLDGMLNMLHRLIGENIDLVWLPDKNIASVKIDPHQLNQILANLCVNARDAIADTGKITIVTGNAVLDKTYCANHPGFVPGEYVLLTVHDSGCGMNMDIQEKVFEPFFTTKEPGKGTGLGLATVYGIVKQNHGFINVESTPGAGTSIHVFFPPHNGKIHDAEPAPVAAVPCAKGETVLIVEDEIAILNLSKKMLEILGYRVLDAINPNQALSLAEKQDNTIDLLMTDVVMPEMNGKDLADQLQKRHPELKVLFMSGYTANVIARHGVLDAGVHFIQKPFSMEELAEKMRQILENSEP